jgi:hypothetical protein
MALETRCFNLIYKFFLSSSAHAFIKLITAFAFNLPIYKLLQYF